MWQWQDKLCQYTKIFLKVIFQNFDSFFMYLRCFARESVSFRSAVLSLAGGLQPLLCYWPTPDNHAWTPAHARQSRVDASENIERARVNRFPA